MGEKKSFHQVAIHMGGMNTDSHLTPCAKFNLITGLIVEAKTINLEKKNRRKYDVGICKEFLMTQRA